jgi:myo-inositol-1(or 4)-monophosphatase
MFRVENSPPPNLPLNHPFLAIALTAASRAGILLVDHFDKGVSHRMKSSANLVTDADLACEAAILSTLQSHHPEHAFMAEESVQDYRDAEHLWIIDPLDGTNNFAHGLPHFAVSIAYLKAGSPQLGVIYNPIRGDWYMTVRGQGAWHNGHRIHVRPDAQLSQVMVGVGFYYDRGAMMEATLAAISDFFRNQIHGIRRFGTASLDLAQVASGLFGSYFEYQLAPWDIAAGVLLVEEAGGKVTDCRGGPIRYDAPTSLLATNGALHSASLEITERHSHFVARAN